MIRKHFATTTGLRRVATVLAATCLLMTIAYAADDVTQPIHLSSDGHFVAQPDCKPFLWLSDTRWAMSMRLNREESDVYLKDRADKGFTLIQAVAIGGPLDLLDVPNRCGDLALIDKDSPHPNPKRFVHIDWVAYRAAQYGLRIAILMVCKALWLPDCNTKQYSIPEQPKYMAVRSASVTSTNASFGCSTAISIAYSRTISILLPSRAGQAGARLRYTISKSV